MNKSFANTPHAIIGAISEVGKYFKNPITWWTKQGGNLLDIFPINIVEQLGHINEIIKYKSQIGGVNEINEWLKANKFTISLPDPCDDQSIATVCIVEIKVRWAEKYRAEKDSLKLLDGTTVPAISMENVGDIWNVDTHAYPIIKLETHNKISLYLTKFTDPPPCEKIDLFNLVTLLTNDIFSKKKSNKDLFSGNVLFPMVDFHQAEEIEWLIGAFHNNKNNEFGTIEQALSEYVLKMNHEGVTAKSSVAICDWLGADELSNITINSPFIIWFESDDVIPFCAYISKEHMNDPMSLNC